MTTGDGLRPAHRHGDASEPVGEYPWVGETGTGATSADLASSADEVIEAYAQAYDAYVLPGLGDVLRGAWREVRSSFFPPPCDCPMDPHHRWNCALTPVWAQTMRDLDVNPWTALRGFMWVFEDIAPWIRIRSTRCDICSCCYPWAPCRPDCHVCWSQPANREDYL